MAKFIPKKKKTGRERPIGTHVDVQHDNFERALRLGRENVRMQELYKKLENVKHSLNLLKKERK